MLVFKAIIFTAIAYVAIWTMYVSFIPLAAKLRRSPSVKQYSGLRAGNPSIAVIIPAFNMEKVISRCVLSLKASDYPMELVEIFVVADHCTDQTATRAVEAGGTVLAREDGARGKTYALAWAFDALAERGVVPEMYVVVDATARVDPAFLGALAARYIEGEDIIISRAVLDTENQLWFAQCLGLTLAHRNLQNWARERLRLSAFISGRGMAYSRQYIRKFGWSLALPESNELGAHPTEDWRHGVRIAEEGLRAAFASGARIYTPLRGTLSAATQQGIRWERGRIRNATTYGARLLKLGIRERDVKKAMAAFDAIQPPVAILTGLCLVVAFLSPFVFVSRLSIVIGFLPIALIGVYSIAVMTRGRQDGIKARTILWAPVYVAWRCMSFVLALDLRERLKYSRGRKKSA